MAEKGSKSVYLTEADNVKEHIATLLTVNAAGQLTPTMIVFRYQRIRPLYYLN